MLFSSPSPCYLASRLFQQPVSREPIVLFGCKADLFYSTATYRVYRLREDQPRVLVYLNQTTGWHLLAWFRLQSVAAGPPVLTKQALERVCGADFETALQAIPRPPVRSAPRRILPMAQAAYVHVPVAILLALATFFGVFYLHARLLHPRPEPVAPATKAHLERLQDSFAVTGVIEAVRAVPDSGQPGLAVTLRDNPTVYRVTPRSLNLKALPELQEGRRLRMRVSRTYPDVVLHLDPGR